MLGRMTSLAGYSTVKPGHDACAMQFVKAHSKGCEVNLQDSPAVAIIGGDRQEGSIAGPGQVCDCLKVQSTQHSYWSWLLHRCIKSVMDNKQWNTHMSDLMHPAMHESSLHQPHAKT